MTQTRVLTELQELLIGPSAVPLLRPRHHPLTGLVRMTSSCGFRRAVCHQHAVSRLKSRCPPMPDASESTATP